MFHDKAFCEASIPMCRGGVRVGAVGAIVPTVFEESSIVTYDLHPQFWRGVDY